MNSHSRADVDLAGEENLIPAEVQKLMDHHGELFQKKDNEIIKILAEVFRVTKFEIITPLYAPSSFGVGKRKGDLGEEVASIFRRHLLDDFNLLSSADGELKPEDILNRARIISDVRSGEYFSSLGINIMWEVNNLGFNFSSGIDPHDESPISQLNPSPILKNLMNLLEGKDEELMGDIVARNLEISGVTIRDMMNPPPAIFRDIRKNSWRIGSKRCIEPFRQFVSRGFSLAL